MSDIAQVLIAYAPAVAAISGCLAGSFVARMNREQSFRHEQAKMRLMLETGRDAVAKMPSKAPKPPN